MLSQIWCLGTPIIVIAVAYGMSCTHVMCVVWPPHVGETATNSLVSIISRSSYCFLWGDMRSKRIIHPLLTQVINAHVCTLEISSVFFYLVNVEASSVSDYWNLPIPIMLMEELWPSSIHRNIVGIFGMFIFDDVVVWSYVESTIHWFPRVEICAVALWKVLKCIFYLGNMKVFHVSAHHH